VAREEAAKTLDQIRKQGMQVTELPPEEVAKLREKSKPISDKYRKEIGEELVSELYAQIEKARNSN